MQKTRPVKIILLLAFLLLSCRTVSVPLGLAPTYTPLPSATFTPIPPTATFTNTPTATFTLTPSATPLPSNTPTSTPIPATATIEPTPLALDMQLRIFDDLWNIINDEYLYPDFNGLDWPAIYDEYQARINEGLSNQEFYLAMDEMIARLGDEHSVFLSPEVVAEEDAEYAGNLDYAGIGVLINAVPERQRAVIILIFPDSPAEEAGLQARDSILSVDGQVILDKDGFLRDIVRGPEGSVVRLVVQTPGESPREVAITRQRITTGYPVPNQVLTSPAGMRIGYILLATFSDLTINERFNEALQALTATAPLDGLIIDNRMNGGGADTVLRPSLSHFTSGTLGYFYSRYDERPLDVRLDDINGSAEVPLVVMVGPDTASYGEVFAGVLQDQGRAYIIGETTFGNVETLWGYDFEDGSRAWIAHDSFRPAVNPEANWEETGIIPDLDVIVNWDEYTVEADPAVLAALDYFDGK
ncbi:MAG: PDZ domain-containing protein [Anaerolineales bacterium]|nr:PDZ domain-containing protein [Anaerolineales bacterium]